MTVVSADTFTYLDSALAAAQSGVASANWFQNLLRPSVTKLQSEHDQVTADLQTLGWVDQTVTEFGTFSIDAQAAAADSWTADLTSQHSEIAATLGAMTFSDPTGTAATGPTSQLSQFWSQAMQFLAKAKIWVYVGIGLILLIYIAPIIDDLLRLDDR